MAETVRLGEVYSLFSTSFGMQKGRGERTRILAKYLFGQPLF